MPKLFGAANLPSVPSPLNSQALILGQNETEMEDTMSAQPHIGPREEAVALGPSDPFGRRGFLGCWSQVCSWHPLSACYRGKEADIVAYPNLLDIRKHWHAHRAQLMP
jgi:hypothetical protein